jgi:hypothetical protein
MISSLLIYTFLSATLGFSAFVNNSTPSLLGSMMLSPIMSPLTNAFNPHYKGPKLELENVMLIMSGLAVFVFIVGVIYGLLKNYLAIYPLETDFMKKRTETPIIIAQFLSTIMVGIGVAFAIKEDNKLARTALTLGILLVPIAVIGGLYLGNYIFLKHKNLSSKLEPDVIYELEQYHIKNSIKFICIFAINICLTGLTFVLVTKYFLN